MMASPLSRAVRHVCQTVLHADCGARSDGELLGRFLAERDGGAFAALVRRHGAMVLGVCRRLLGHHQDAEDAFQATFLVLVRKAASVTPRERVGPWLFGVARRTALAVKAARARRRVQEVQVRPTPPAGDVADDLARRELTLRVDAEVARLPEKYRAAVLLCDLGGKSRAEAARLLGWPEGTVSTRLLRARQRLARRLGAYGPACQVGVAAVLVESTVAAAAAGALPRVAALAEGVVQTMITGKLKTLAALAVCVALAFAAGVWTRSAPAGQAPAAQVGDQGKQADPKEAAAQADLRRGFETVRWFLHNKDLQKGTIDVSDVRLWGGYAESVLEYLNGGKTNPYLLINRQYIGKLGLEKLPVAKDAKISIDGKAGSLKDVQDWMPLTLTFAKDKLVVTAIDATTPPEVNYTLKAVDAAKGVVTVTGDKGVVFADVPVASDATVTFNYKGDKGKVADLEAGMRVSLRLVVAEGRLVVRDIRAYKVKE